MSGAPRYTPAQLAALLAKHPPPHRPAPEKQGAGGESQLQAAAEAWLAHRGYLARTPKNLAGGGAPRGWYIHLSQAEHNPLILDLLILANAGWHLEVELKRAGGRIRECQRQILAACPRTARICYSLPELVEIVTTWEAEHGIA